MRRSEFIEKMKNTKIYVNGKSKEIQEKLFELGFLSSYTKNKASFIDNPFIFVDESYITASSGMTTFVSKPKQEINAEWFLNEPIEDDLVAGEVYSVNNNCPFIFNGNYNNNHPIALCGINKYDNFMICDDDAWHWSEIKDIKPATEAQKAKLFKAIDDEGKVFNKEKMCIEDKAIDWTPQPFERVLVRYSDNEVWMCEIFSHINTSNSFKYVCIGAVGKIIIPFKGNEHLVGTTNSPSEVYSTK